MGTIRRDTSAFPSHGFSRAWREFPGRRPVLATLLAKSQNPLSLQEVSRASAASGEKKTLPEAPAGVSVSCRVTATNLAERTKSAHLGSATQWAIGSAAGYRNFGRFPFRPVCDGRRSISVRHAAAFASQVSPRAKDRLTRVQQLFTRNPSPHQSSGASPEYLLLPPRSAPEAAPGGLTPSPLQRTPLRSLLLTVPSRQHSARRHHTVALVRRPGVGATLKRHPFSGPVASAGESLHTP